MSKQAEAWSENVVTGNAGRKQILDRLAYRANHPHWICWPSNADLERTTEQKRSTVRGNLKALEEGGFIARIQRRRQNGTMQTAAIVLLGRPLAEIVAEVEAIEKPHYVVADILPDLKNLLEAQKPALKSGAGEETAENSQSGTSAEIHQVADIAQPAPESDPLELKENNKFNTPLNPPGGGNPDFTFIDDFRLGKEFAQDIADQSDLPLDFVLAMVERWKGVARDAVAGGSRIKSLASNFRNWLTRHKNLKAMRLEWYRETQGRAPASKPAVVTADEVFATAAGRAALNSHVGCAFLDACLSAKKLLDQDTVDRLVAESEDAKTKPMDDISRMVANAGAERERNLRTKYLKADVTEREHLAPDAAKKSECSRAGTREGECVS